MHLPCIDEIIIQNQNWSTNDSLYLYETVARYIDDFGVKIVILPSTFHRAKSRTTKRSQFFTVGQPRIRNRVIQFLVNETFITAAPDAAIYGESYPDTNRKLEAFEELAKERAKEGKHTAGFMLVYSITEKQIHVGSEPNSTIVNWKSRINHFVTPFQYCGAPVHDFQIAIFDEGRWRQLTPRSGHYMHMDFKGEWEFKLDLKILHYGPLFHPHPESAKFVPQGKDGFKSLEEHPRHYIEKLLT